MLIKQGLYACVFVYIRAFYFVCVHVCLFACIGADFVLWNMCAFQIVKLVKDCVAF